MNILRNIVSELIGLFVDDWVFALLLIGWVALFAIAGPRLSANAAGPLFLLGIALLVLTSTARKAKAKR